MNRRLILRLIIVVIAVILIFIVKSPGPKLPTGPQLTKENIDEVVAAMTVEEKADMLVGSGMRSMIGSAHPVVGSTQQGVNGAAGTTNAIPRLGIPFIVLSDGPAGVRINPTRKRDTSTYYATAFPTGTLLSSSWDTSVVRRVGKAIGNEVLEYGIDIILAPGMNIMRNPLCGRNFEYYSEDPLLTGKIASAMIGGIQSNGVGTSVKHFAFNNQETNRDFNDARVSQRAIREIYLRGFEIAVKEAKPWTVMSSYNQINGEFTAHSRGLLTDILRDEWGFKGTVMTDWYGGKDAVKQVAAGNDLQEPGRKKQRKEILKAINNGTLSMKDVDTSVKRILELITRSATFRTYANSDKPDLKAHAMIAREAAAAGMVLLENKAALPIDSTIKNIALFGTASYDIVVGGGGSGFVNRLYEVSPSEGLENAGFVVNKGIKQVYDKYFADNAKKMKKPKNPLMAILNTSRIPELMPGEDEIKASASVADLAVITIGRNQGEGKDRLEKDDFLLTDTEQKMIESVCNSFHSSGKKVVVVLNIGGIIETASWKTKPDAILIAWQAGQEGGNAIADVLKGAYNPSGRLPMTLPLALADDPSSSNFPMTEYKTSYLKKFLGLEKEKKAEDKVKDIDFTNYHEDIYVGYRYYNTFNVKVSYPFGYGLSYTTFGYGKPEIKEVDGNFSAIIDITNNGQVAGSEVVELYATSPGNSAGQPANELIAFAKTGVLAPGQSETVTLSFTLADLAWFDTDRMSWVTDAGNYTLAFSSSSVEARETAMLKIKDEVVFGKVHDVLRPLSSVDVITRK
ncbi:MAG: glycoside hydrolase family 3 C-terminal domain-containing protein [Bacteroidales bacterium]